MLTLFVPTVGEVVKYTPIHPEILHRHWQGANEVPPAPPHNHELGWFIFTSRHDPLHFGNLLCR